MLVRAYRPLVHFVLARPAITLVTAALAAISCLPIVSHLGSEFLPHIDEGELLYMPTAAAGLSADDAHGELTEQDRDIAALPGVQTVFGKIGRSDSATDPAPYSMAETTIRLKPRASWPRVFHARWYSSWAPEPVKRLLRRIWPERAPMTTDELVEHLDAHTYRPGWTNAWTAPVRARMDMMSTGVRTPVGVRVVAADPARLDALGAAVEAAVRKVPGTRSAVYEGAGRRAPPGLRAGRAGAGALGRRSGARPRGRGLRRDGRRDRRDPGRPSRREARAAGAAGARRRRGCTSRRRT